MSLPKVAGLFRLTRDCEVSYSQGGTAVVKFGLAASEKYKDKETKLFIDATAFGKMGEVISEYAGTKGTQIFLSGKLQLDTWQDKNTGENRSKTTMTIEGFDFVSSQGVSQSNGGQQGNQGQPQQAPQQSQGQPQPQPVGGNQGRPQRPGQFNAPNDFDDSIVPF